MTKAETQLMLDIAEGVRLSLMAHYGSAGPYQMDIHAKKLDASIKAVKKESAEDQHG